MHGEDRAQTWAARDLLGAAVDRVELPVGLGDAELELALADLADVVGRAAGRGCGAPDAVLAALLAAFRGFLVDHAADGVADHEIHAGRASGTDGDELTFLCGRAADRTEARADENDRGGCGCREIELFHDACSSTALAGNICGPTPSQRDCWRRSAGRSSETVGPPASPPL